MRNRPTRLFLRFRDRGDGTAFAQLFDLVAPELLAVAVRVAPDVATAEDLVQTTFVAAIERARTFEAARDVKPWLFGILTREAVLARRRAARRLDLERVRHDDVEPNPLETVAAAETQALVERALEGLGDTYRSVLRPYLLEGLGAAEIARRAGPRRMSPGHVRVAIGRGLTQLVRSLPRGVALGTAVDATSARGLAAIRDLVLSDAGVRPGTVLATTSPAAVVASVLAAAAAAMVISLALRTSANEGRSSASTELTSKAVQLPATDAGQRGTVLVAVESEGRSVLDAVDEGVQDAERTPFVAHARRRVVDAAGLPVEGARIVSLGGVRYPDRILSAADGTFHWPWPSPPSTVLVWHEHFAATRHPWRTEPEEIALLEPAALLEVDVVDEQVGVVSRAAVALTHKDDRYHPGWPSAVFEGLVTDDAGRAHFAGLPHGKFELRVTAQGYVEERVQLELETGARRSLSVTVRKGRRVTGSILDLRGVPIEGAVAGVRGSRTITSVRPDGTYALDGVPFTEVELFAAHEDKRGARVRIDAGSDRTWNVVLEDLYVLRGVVIDDEGRPLEGWYVCLLEGGDSPADYRAREMELFTRGATIRSGGNFELDKVPASDFALSIRGPRYGREDGPALVLTDLVAPMPSLVLRVPRPRR
jgi:RNA polymerase sigma factor (sigma-70 family)